ncbi:hypothetical protein TYRP_018255 [Tyrophagus putrescentiae]|nr:hypothetical protein TYRP_018255 [Tyrophagus putrescentiae]
MHSSLVITIIIIICLLLLTETLNASEASWSLMQEKIMTEAYLIEIDFFFNHHHHHYNSTTSDLISVSSSASHPLMYSVRFLNAQFLIFFCRLLAFSIACGNLVASHRRHLFAYLLHSRQPALHCYSYCSLSNILSSWAQYEALKYVSFSVQVLSRGGKMMAVMLMAVVVGGKRYKQVEWAFALSISLGIWLFLLNEEEEEVKHRMDHHNSSTADSPSQMLVSGLLLLTLYLTFDSFTSNWQAALFDGSPSLSSVHMMAAVNLWSLSFTFVSLFSQLELLSALRLLPGNPALLRDLLLLATACAVSQLFVYHIIARFGAVLFTLIMTLRQVLAILLSILIFLHPLTVWGVLGITIVFSSLFTNIYLKYKAKVEGVVEFAVKIKHKPNDHLFYCFID